MTNWLQLLLPQKVASDFIAGHAVANVLLQVS